jgi:hypothetical protein
MVAALGGAGYYFGSSPTTSTSESNVALADSSMPWETGSTKGKYQYHPGGDKSAEPKDAPSAVNVVIVPNVNLPKVRCTTSEGWRNHTDIKKHRACMINSTSGVRRATRKANHGFKGA